MLPVASSLWRALLAVGSFAIVVVSFIGGALSATLFAVVAAAFPLALIALGARRGPRRGVVLAGLGLLLVGGALALVLFPPSGSFLGLPAATALMLAGLGILPLLLVVWGHAATGRSGPPD